MISKNYEQQRLNQFNLNYGRGGEYPYSRINDFLSEIDARIPELRETSDIELVFINIVAAKVYLSLMPEVVKRFDVKVIASVEKELPRNFMRIFGDGFVSAFLWTLHIEELKDKSTITYDGIVKTLQELRIKTKKTGHPDYLSRIEDTYGFVKEKKLSVSTIQDLEVFFWARDERGLYGQGNPEAVYLSEISF